MGACRIPDPTTAGDFLRSFKTAADVEQLSAVIDEVQEEAWSKLPRHLRRQRARHELALVDLDGHIKPLYGEHKEGGRTSATTGAGPINRWWCRWRAAANVCV